MKDHELIKLAKRINNYQSKINDLVDKIENSGRSDALDISNALFVNQIPIYSDAVLIVTDVLNSNKGD